MKASRVLTLDAARGLLAFGVLVYHSLGWGYGLLLPQIGRYGVYSFFAISGFSLYFTYRDRLADAATLREYFILRVFRIAPLLYLATALTLAVYGFADQNPDHLFFTLTLLFGFANPGQTAAVTGGWSIGIELTLYVIFPAIVMISSGSARRLAVLATVFFVGQMFFVNDILRGSNVVEAWVQYTQPMAFVGYFAFGCLFAELYLRNPRWKGSTWPIVGAIVSFVPFLFVGVGSSDILTGIGGIGLAIAAITLVGCIAWLPEPTGVLIAAAKWLGRMSYSVYLLHPIVYTLVARVRVPEAQIPLTLIATIVLSEAVFRLIEAPAVALGRRVVTLN